MDAKRESELIRALSERRDLPGVVRIAAHLGTLCVTGVGISMAMGSGWVVPAMIVHGAVLVFLFTPLHETIHRTAFATEWPNRVVADLAGLLLFLPARWFAHFHHGHHRFTQDPERDPELMTPKPTTRGRYLLYLSGWYYWTGLAPSLLRRATGRADDWFVPERRRNVIVAEARGYLAVYAGVLTTSLATGSAAALWYWIVPALLGQPFLRAYLLAEHWGCPETGSFWERTRTVVTNPVVRFYAWNMPYHAEHHAHPGVPFHRLPDLARARADRRVVVSPGYVPFHAREVPGILGP